MLLKDSKMIRLSSGGLLFFVLFSAQAFGADCTVIYSLPLALTGSQNGLSYSGTIGGKGNGRYNSTCPTRYQFDYRYNIVSKNAVCINLTDNRSYIASVRTLSASLDNGAMTRYSDLSAGNESFEVWGKAYPGGIFPGMGLGNIYGFYSTKMAMDVSSLPAGRFSCEIKNTHGAYVSQSNNPGRGGQVILNQALSLGASGWATGRVTISINAACRINNTQTVLGIDHGSVLSGTESVKQVSMPVICNKDSNVTVRLSGGVAQNDGVLVNVGASKSLVSVSSHDSGADAAQLSVNVKNNVNTNIVVKSKLMAKGSGYQSGNVIMTVTYI